MGNKISINIDTEINTNFEINILDLPKELLIYILEYLHNDIKSLLNFSRICKLANDLANDNILWKFMSHEYKKNSLVGNTITIESIYNQIIDSDINWKTIYKNLLNKIIKSALILIGDRINPTSKILLQLNINGDCYISSLTGYINYEKYHGEISYITNYNNNIYYMMPINSFKTPLYAPMDDLGISKYIPFTNDGKKYKFIKYQRSKMNNIKIINFETYDPYILLLSNDNRIFEFMLTPSWMDEYKWHSIPNEVNLQLQPNEHIIKMKCSPIGNFVIISSSPKNKILFWTMIDGDNYSPKIIPYHDTNFVNINIVDIENIGSSNCKFIYYKNNEKHIYEILTTDIYLLLL